MAYQAEYIWIDGTEPTAKIRSKTKIVHKDAPSSVEDLPIWGFDGSSTNQATGESSDCMLKPVFWCKDPVRGGKNISRVGPQYWLFDAKGKKLLEEGRKNQCSFKSGTAELEKGCDTKAKRLAQALIDAAANRTAITPLTDRFPDLDIPTAYGLQDAVVQARVSHGAAVAARVEP